MDRYSQLAQWRTAKIVAPQIEFAAWDQVRPILDESLAELGKLEREALLLRFFEGRSWDEISSRLALDSSRSRRTVADALAALRCKLERRAVRVSESILSGLLTLKAVSEAPSGILMQIMKSARYSRPQRAQHKQSERSIDY